MALPAPITLWVVQDALGDIGASNVALAMLLWGGLLFPLRAAMPVYLVERQRGLQHNDNTMYWALPVMGLSTSILGLMACFILGTLSHKYVFLQNNYHLIATFAFSMAMAEIPLCELLRQEKTKTLVLISAIRVAMYSSLAFPVIHDAESVLFLIGYIEAIFASLALVAFFDGRRKHKSPSSDS